MNELKKFTIFMLMLILFGFYPKYALGSEYSIGYDTDSEVMFEVIAIDDTGLAETFGERYYKDCEFLENGWKSKVEIDDISKDGDEANITIGYWGWRVDDFGETLPVEKTWEISVNPNDNSLPIFWIFPEELLKAYYFIPTPVDDFLEEFREVLGEKYNAEGNMLIYESTSQINVGFYVEFQYNQETGFLQNVKIKNDNGNILAEIDSGGMIPSYPIPPILIISLIAISGIIIINHAKVKDFNRKNKKMK